MYLRLYHTCFSTTNTGFRTKLHLSQTLIIIPSMQCRTHTNERTCKCLLALDNEVVYCIIYSLQEINPSYIPYNYHIFQNVSQSQVHWCSFHTKVVLVCIIQTHLLKVRRGDGSTRKKKQNRDVEIRTSLAMLRYRRWIRWPKPFDRFSLVKEKSMATLFPATQKHNSTSARLVSWHHSSAYAWSIFSQ